MENKLNKSQVDSKWSEEEMQEAIEESKNTSLSLRQLAMKFNVPKSTLYDRLNGKQSRFTSSQNALSKFSENLIVDLLGHLAAIGYGLN